MCSIRHFILHLLVKLKFFLVSCSVLNLQYLLHCHWQGINTIYCRWMIKKIRKYPKLFLLHTFNFLLKHSSTFYVWSWIFAFFRPASGHFFLKYCKPENKKEMAIPWKNLASRLSDHLVKCFQDTFLRQLCYSNHWIFSNCFWFSWSCSYFDVDSSFINCSQSSVDTLWNLAMPPMPGSLSLKCVYGSHSFKKVFPKPTGFPNLISH